MTILVLGETLADAEAFCQRNPDFKDAHRCSVMSRYPDVTVEQFVITPAAQQIQDGRRSYMIKCAMVLAHNLRKTWLAKKNEE